MSQADLDVLAVASVEFLTNTLANMPEPTRGHRLRAISESLETEVAKKRMRVEQSVPKRSGYSVGDGAFIRARACVPIRWRFLSRFPLLPSAHL